MKLYLSSFDLGHEPSALVSLAPGARVAVIVNALDNRPHARARWLASQSAKLAALGFSAEELDLRRFFDQRMKAAAALRDFDMVWINGGNAFLLRRALGQSGLDEVVSERVAGNSLVYAGFSAAAVIASASLRGLELVDDPHDVADGYDPAVIWDGLGFLPYAVVVHFMSDHPETEKVNLEIEFYERQGIAYRTLRDGEAIVMDGGHDTMRIAWHGTTG